MTQSTHVRALLDEAARRAASGQIDEALAAYAAVLDESPRLAEVHYNVAALRLRKGDLSGARTSLDAALELRPHWPQAQFDAGRIAFREGRFEDAERAFGRAAAISPDPAQALLFQANALDRLRRWPEALPLLRRARELRPDDEDIWFALRSHLLLFQRQDEAFEDFRAFEPRAMRSARVVAAGLLSARIAPGVEYENKYLPLALEWPYAAGDAPYAGVAVAQAQYFDVSRPALKRLYDAYDRLRQDERSGLADFARPRPRLEGPLRIGYLSADFRDHVMGRLMFEVISRHDPRRVAVHAYSIAARELEDKLTHRFRGVCASFVRLDDLDHRSAARAVADDELDVLVDLMCHSGSSRPAILLYKPAPVIVTHLGSHGAIGLRQVDFKLTDTKVDLPDAADYQIERPLALDGCVLPVRHVAPSNEAFVTREALGIADGAVVFGTFVSLLKLAPRCLELWRTILERVPGGVLAFSPHRESARPLFLRRLASFGIEASRVAFIPWTLDEAKDRARYSLVDVVLDTLPYSGGDTTAAALDMGVPVVTRVGKRAAERMTYSLLAHVGVTDTVAESDEDYVAIACRLAGDPSWRASIAAAIAARLPSSGLADLHRYARSLEDAYERAVALKAG
jgi:predicted O-linked N-acetylglucosamine transferase (SPINDLY family)